VSLSIFTGPRLTTDWGKKSPKTCYWAGGPFWRICRPRSADQTSTIPPPPPAEAVGRPGAGAEDPPPADGRHPQAGGVAGETGAVPR
jgi:hypothetical protein